MMRQFDVLIVGGGHAGAQLSIALRQRRYVGSVGILSAEPDLPYERPPLSKDYLAGDRTADRLQMRPASFWAEREIEILTETCAVAVDAQGRTVTTANGDVIGYGDLVWAAGGHARRLAGENATTSGVHVIRCRADVDQARRELSATRQVVVIGGGYIGLEAAAVLRKLDKQVVVLEAQDRVLARVAGSVLSRFYEAEHRARGVDLRLGVAVAQIVAESGRVSGVRLSDGEHIACDMIIAGVGIIPAVEPLLAAGAEGGNGVAVDGYCRTTLPRVWAIGDCALHVNTFAGGTAIRLESVQNANDQAMVVAKALTGAPEPYTALPWFWSNQYDLKLQTVGISAGFDSEIVRGDPASRSFSSIYLRDGAVVALDCVNAARDFVQGRELVAHGSRVAPERLADAAVPLKDLVAEAA